jgi:hypothetical protein
LDSKIDTQISLPTTNLYEGRIITHKGKVYIYYNGAWLSLSDLAILAEKAEKAEKAELAEDLVGRPEVYHEEFTFQATANTDSVRDGLATVKSIKGNTVVVNQLVNENGTLSLIANRKYFCEINGVKSIITATSGQVLEVNAGDVVIDLTKFFNTGNKSTALEEFERLYPNLPTDYNEGSLLNLNADSIKSVGFNAFNSEYAKVLGGMQYYLGGNITSLAFKENLEDEGEVIEIPSDNLYTPSTNGYIVATGNSICINLSHSGYRNGEYEPYKESIANLPIRKYFPDGMKSAGNIKDEIVWDEGLKKYKAVQRVGSVDLGTLGWIKSSKSGILGVDFYEGSNEILKANHDIICQEYLVVSTQDSLLNTNKSIINSWLYYRGLNVHDDEAWNSMTAAEFKASLSGKYLYYKLATPIETIIDDYALIEYEVSDFGTEEILSDKPTTPIIAEIQYGFNAVDVIRNNLFNIKDLFKLLLTKLSLTGGTMSGAIDMSTNPFIKAGFEYVEELPTKYNFIGRQVFFNNNPYWWTGKEWITFPENSGGGEPTGDFWNLLEANPETDYSVVEIKNRLDSVFPLFYENYGTYLNSRNIYVDLSKYEDSYSYIMDLFGDIKEVPIGVRYHIFVGGYNNNLKIDFPLEYSTNWSYTHTPGFDGYTSELYCIPYSKAIKIEFIKLSDSFVWVDVENYGGMPGYSTATATNSESTNNIVSYCNNNKIEINYDKDTGNAIFNLVDILSSITTKLK